MTEQQANGGSTVTVPTPLSAGAAAAYESMINQVPDADSGDGLDRLLAQIAGATDLSQLDAPWRTSDFERLIGLPLTINSIAKLPSTYAGGLAWFLVVEAVREDTGELITVTTGATMVVAQLVKAFLMGGLPCRVRVVIPERPTRNGTYPQHLEFLPRSGGAGNGSGASA